MYFPYFRGKRYELITIRETAETMAASGFVPVIDPVREEWGGLRKALDAVCRAGGRAVLIVNPEHGPLRADRSSIAAVLGGDFEGNDNLLAGIRLDTETTAADALRMFEDVDGRGVALVHAGFKEANLLTGSLEGLPVEAHVFMEDDCGKLYQMKFREGERILVRDGFERRRNRDHPGSEFFSDLHITFDLEGMSGFGDFLIVGDDYSESGGPAYTVAIHLTYIDPDQDDAMYILHFLSDRRDTPKDPGGKFSEALAKLVEFLAGPSGHKIHNSSAIEEFRDLHERGHYPGLGYVKKLSMRHHIETLAHFLSQPAQQI